MSPKIAALFLLLTVSGTSLTASAADGIERFFGAFVGSAVAERVGADGVEQRDLDVNIQRYRQNGFTIKWITVTLGAGGARTGPGVTRRAVEDDFVPSADMPGVFILAPKGGIFTRAELPNPLKGEPMRWASVAGDRLSVYSLGINDDGAELQIYHRTLLADGSLDSEFLRMQNEKVELRVFGKLTRMK